MAFARGFGTKSANGTATVEPTTLFRTGSTGKMLSTLCVLESVEAGELDLANPVTRHVLAYHRSIELRVGFSFPVGNRAVEMSATGLAQGGGHQLARGRGLLRG